MNEGSILQSEQVANLKHYVADRLYHSGMVKFSEKGFPLKLHAHHRGFPLSPFYIDLRPLRSYPSLLVHVAAVMVDSFPSLWSGVKRLSDIPLASSPIVTLMSQHTGIPMITPRIGGKTHGINAEILGEYESGDPVVIGDDVRSDGESKKDVIVHYRNYNLLPKAAVVLVDRGSPEGAPIEDVPVEAVFNISGLFLSYRKSGAVQETLYDRCVSYPEEMAAHVATCKGC